MTDEPRYGQEPLESAMETGQGADDEPSLTIGDKFAGDDPPDPDGDGRLSVGEAESLLGVPDASRSADDNA